MERKRRGARGAHQHHRRHRRSGSHVSFGRLHTVARRRPGTCSTRARSRPIPRANTPSRCLQRTSITGPCRTGCNYDPRWRRPCRAPTQLPGADLDQQCDQRPAAALLQRHRGTASRSRPIKWISRRNGTTTPHSALTVALFGKKIRDDIYTGTQTNVNLGTISVCRRTPAGTKAATCTPFPWTVYAPANGANEQLLRHRARLAAHHGQRLRCACAVHAHLDHKASIRTATRSAPINAGAADDPVGGALL